MATAKPQTNQTSERRDFRKEVTDSIAKMLEEGVAPWQKPWDASVAGTLTLPFNPTSNNSYRGGNAIHLLATAMRKGYEDPRWMTYKQAAENDWQVRKGEKGTQIEFWEIKRANEADNENPSSSPATNPESGRRDDQSRSQFIHRVYTVFNATQIEGVPAYEPKHRSPFEIVEAGEQILRNSGARVTHDQADRAFYSRSSDSIHLPPREAFDGAPGYYGTALHELAHWSGHPDRLNRQTLNQSYRFGDQNYAREELRAELASVFLAAERGIPHNPATHASYVGSWIKALRDDKNEIFRAAHDASRATEFLLSLERDRSIGETLVESPVASASDMEQEVARIESDLESDPAPVEPIAIPASIETGDSITRFESKDGIAKVHNNALGIDELVAVGPYHSHARGGGSEPGSSPSNEQQKSFQAAQSLTAERLGEGVRLTSAVTEGGRYRGSVIGETDDLLIQQISSRSAVAHSKDLLDSTPQVGQKVSVAYVDSHATVREIRERAKSQELAR